MVRGEQPDLGEDAAAKLRDEVTRDQLHLRVVGSLPLDRATAQRELTDEQRAMRGSRPTTRRWKAVTRLDDAIAKLARSSPEPACGFVVSAWVEPGVGWMGRDYVVGV